MQLLAFLIIADRGVICKTRQLLAPKVTPLIKRFLSKLGGARCACKYTCTHSLAQAFTKVREAK